MKNIPAEIYSHKRTVDEEDLDELLHVNNVRYVQWIQDIAKEHWEVRATPQLKKRILLGRYPPRDRLQKGRSHE